VVLFVVLKGIRSKTTEFVNIAPITGYEDNTEIVRTSRLRFEVFDFQFEAMTEFVVNIGDVET